MKRLKRNIQVGRINYLLILIHFFLTITISPSFTSEKLEKIDARYTEIKILDKVSSKSNLLKLKVGEEKKFSFGGIKKLLEQS